MADMYPNNQEVTMNGEVLTYPGVDENGKFTNGDFNNPLKPPSFIPAESINLLLDNIGNFIKALGGTPNNSNENQISPAFSSFINALKTENTEALSSAASAIALNMSRTSRNARLGFPYGKERFVTFGFDDINHRSVKIAADVHIRLDIPTESGTEERWFDTTEVT